MDPEMTALGLQLANTAVRNSASTVAERISSARTRKRDQETIAELEDIVNELVADKAELIRIAQAYEEELVTQRLSPENVEYIIESIAPVLEGLIGDSGDEAAVQKMMELLQPILSVETLTVLQLVGFNFKRAIGEPLTEVLHQKIMLLSKRTAAVGLRGQAALERGRASDAVPRRVVTREHPNRSRSGPLSRRPAPAPASIPQGIADRPHAAVSHHSPR